MASSNSTADRPTRRLVVLSCLALVLIVGFEDAATRTEGLSALLYLIPVALGAWLVGRSFALLLSAICVANSFGVEWPNGSVLDHFGQLGVFVAATTCLTLLKSRDASARDALGIVQGILDALPARVFWKDKNLVYLGCNAAFARDAGFDDPKDVIGKDDHQMLWRNQAELYRADDRQVLLTGAAKLLIEEPLTTAAGHDITLLTSKVPLRGTDGEPSGVLGTYLDISDRKRAEDALMAAEGAYRRLFESTKDGILIVDAETGTIIDANPFLAELLGLSREALLGNTIWELGCFGDIFGSRAHFAEVQKAGYVRYDDKALDARDGQRIDVEFFANAYQVKDQTLIQCNIRDVTDRKRAQESTARLATAVDQAAEAVMITDASGFIRYVNPAFERTTGYTSTEAIGQNPRILKSGKQDDLFYKQMWTVLSEGGVWRGFLVNKRKDGSLFEERATISAVRDAAGHVVSYVAVKHDITNEKLLEKQLFQSQKMEAVGRLAGGVAHDFNNLLGVIMGYGEIVRRQLASEDPLKAKVAQILRAGERAASLTRQLLAFSRKQVLQPRVLDLNTVVSDMDKMLRRLIGEDIEFTTLLASGLGSVRADPGQIEQVVMNLAVNSRDAMPEGGRLAVETRNVDLDAEYAATHSPAVPGRYVAIVITDTGSGMDAATQARIFEPFFSTKAVGEGTGLGLATVYGIVKQSDGYIWVYSEVGVGTTFKIYLPRIDEEAEFERQPEPGPPARGSETVLLVEDESSLREMLCEVLEADGYSVLVARDGAEALQIAQAHRGPIEIMVTDVVMPGMTGPKIVDFLAPTRPEIKVLFLSGYSDETVVRHGLVEPGRAFLSKPFGAAVLLRKVRESLDAA